MSSNQFAQPNRQWLTAMAERANALRQKQANRVTLGGVWLFLIGLTIFLSGVRAFRLPVFNLRLQPFLFPLAVAIPITALRMARFPTRALVGLMLFWALYAISLVGPSIQRVSPFEDATKLAAGVAVVITVAVLVSSRADFVLGSTGLALAIGLLAFRGLEEEQENIIEVANKNSYSLYALPAVLLAIFIAVRVDWKKVSFRKLAIPVGLVCSLAAAIAIVAGANRSGYVGLALIVLMMGFYLVFSPRLRLGKKSQGAVLLICLIAAVVAGLAYKGAEVFEHRYEQTVQGTESDTLRIHLFETALIIGLENPIRGVSPQVLPVMLAHRLYPDVNPGNGVETHNVFAHVIGGSGFIAMGVLLYVAWTLWFWRSPNKRSRESAADFFDARWLLRMMVVLWAVRGAFSQEILYNPGFCMGLGLAIGLCMVELETLKKSATFGPAIGRILPASAARS